MITKGNAIAISILKISELFGKEYLKRNFNKACHSYPDNDNVMFDYFCGFLGDYETNLWRELAYIAEWRKSGQSYNFNGEIGYLFNNDLDENEIKDEINRFIKHNNI